MALNRTDLLKLNDLEELSGSVYWSEGVPVKGLVDEGLMYFSDKNGNPYKVKVPQLREFMGKTEVSANGNSSISVSNENDDSSSDFKKSYERSYKLDVKVDGASVEKDVENGELRVKRLESSSDGKLAIEVDQNSGIYADTSSLQLTQTPESSRSAFVSQISQTNGKVLVNTSEVTDDFISNNSISLGKIKDSENIILEDRFKKCDFQNRYHNATIVNKECSKIEITVKPGAMNYVKGSDMGESPGDTIVLKLDVSDADSINEYFAETDPRCLNFSLYVSGMGLGVKVEIKNISIDGTAYKSTIKKFAWADSASESGDNLYVFTMIKRDSNDLTWLMSRSCLSTAFES